MTKYRDAEWLREQYIEKDKTQEEIATECGVRADTISYWCVKFGIGRNSSACFDTTEKGYERWRCQSGDQETVMVHRLLATLKVDDLDELEGKHVHHVDGIKWDNRAENLQVVSPSEHKEIHENEGLEVTV
jgi:hypothetical protein